MGVYKVKKKIRKWPVMRSVIILELGDEAFYANAS